MRPGNEKPDRKLSIAWPVTHVLALAPLDVWIRIVKRAGGVDPAYWARFAFILITSFVGTICTVHERIVLAGIRRLKFGRDPRVEHEAGSIIILGYYRSGTTHLQNLMSCDAGFVSPRWSQCLAGQGFLIGWSILRFVLVPFLGSTRPQDAVGFGPDWPGEDDFALCTWGGCSSIPGRFVWPSGWEDWKRWHSLEGLSEKELNRWRSLLAMFVWKITRKRCNRTKIVLLKTPSHTARVQELDRLFKGNVKFVHLVRNPTAVVDSNVRLHESLKDHLLEDGLDVQQVRDRIVEEYAYTESKCASELSAIDANRWTRVQYQDLRGDAIGTLEQVYSALGMEIDPRAKDSIQEYLGQLGVYQSDKEDIELGEMNETEQQISKEMIQRYELDKEPVASVQMDSIEDPAARVWRGVMAMSLLALVCICAWLGIVYSVHATWDSMHLRLIPAVWICGAIVGIGAKKASGVGSRSLGSMAAILTILIVLVTAFPVSIINYNFASTEGYSTQDWVYHNSKYAYQGLSSVASLIFIALGAVTAYRHASSSGVEAPGTRQASSERVGY